MITCKYLGARQMVRKDMAWTDGKTDGIPDAVEADDAFGMMEGGDVDLIT